MMSTTMLKQFETMQATFAQRSPKDTLGTIPEEPHLPFFCMATLPSKPREFLSTFKDYYKKKLIEKKRAENNPAHYHYNWTTQKREFNPPIDEAELAKADLDIPAQLEYLELLEPEQKFYQDHYAKQKSLRGFVSYEEFIDFSLDEKQSHLELLRTSIQQISFAADSLRSQYRNLDPNDPDYIKKSSHYQRVLYSYGGTGDEDSQNYTYSRSIFAKLDEEYAVKFQINEVLKKGPQSQRYSYLLFDCVARMREDLKQGIEQKLKDQGIVLTPRPRPSKVTVQGLTSTLSARPASNRRADPAKP